MPEVFDSQYFHIYETKTVADAINSLCFENKNENCIASFYPSNFFQLSFASVFLCNFFSVACLIGIFIYYEAHFLSPLYSSRLPGEKKKWEYSSFNTLKVPL